MPMKRATKVGAPVTGARAGSSYQGFLVYFAQSPLTRALTMRAARAKRSAPRNRKP